MLLSRLIGIAVLVLAWAAPAPAAEISNRVAAVVNDEIITLWELNRRIQEVTGVNAEEIRLRDETRYQQTARIILDDLINDRIAGGKIRELGIEVRPEEVDAAVERVRRINQISQEELALTLEKRGLSLEAYREEIKGQLERSRLINREIKSRIVIREERILDYYREKQEEFSQPAKVRLAVIFFRLEDPENADETARKLQRARDIVTALQAGADFGSLAREHSQGPGAGEGGDVGFFRNSELAPKLAAVVSSLAPGEVGGPVVLPAGVQIVKLLERQGGEVKPIEEVRERIYESLYQEEVNRRYSSWVRELRENAFVQVSF